MPTMLPRNCFLCGKPLRYAATNKAAVKQGLPVGANTHDLNAKSEMHYAHCGQKNSRQQFEDLPDGVWQEMDVADSWGSRLCCYECHEVVCHNPIFSESQMERLATVFQGKAFEERVVILNRIIELGLQGMLPHPQSS